MIFDIFIFPTIVIVSDIAFLNISIHSTWHTVLQQTDSHFNSTSWHNITTFDHDLISLLQFNILTINWIPDNIRHSHPTSTSNIPTQHPHPTSPPNIPTQHPHPTSPPNIMQWRSPGARCNSAQCGNHLASKLTALVLQGLVSRKRN